MSVNLSLSLKCRTLCVNNAIFCRTGSARVKKINRAIGKNNLSFYYFLLILIFYDSLSLNFEQVALGIGGQDHGQYMSENVNLVL